MNNLLGINLVQRIMEKKTKTLAFRGWQMAYQYGLKTVRYWAILESQIRTFWNKTHLEYWLQEVQTNKLLIGPEHLAAFQDWATAYPEWAEKVIAYATGIQHGRFSIFDQFYQLSLDNLPWDSDWRRSHRWLPAYYKTYRFYELDKTIDYDVKFPWELSRFTFLITLAQAASLTKDTSWCHLVAKLIIDWERKNPLAYSVNWCSMECSMRAINLALTAQILAVNSQIDYEQIAPLLRQLTMHGEFLYRNIEFTDIRGNHYAANLIALLLIGVTLQRVYTPAAKWAKYATRRISQEIELQFCEDGVNFEKSIAYHCLVTELFLLGAITMEKCFHPVSPIAYERLRRACEYICYYIRPDGLSPLIGDNDSAQLLSFDLHSPRDHRPLLALASAYFGESIFKMRAEQPSSSIPWLIGTQGVNCWKALRSNEKSKYVSRFFKDSGMMIAHVTENYLIADFGEIGLKGRGGHGHNDTFSFELCLRGQPVIIDPGIAYYTGNLNLHKLYRTTAYHNTLQVDDEEIARLLGVWRISDEAHPYDVHYYSDSQQDSIEGQHKGYSRLADPVIHQRKLTFNKSDGRLICQDTVKCSAVHTVKQFLHVAPNGEVKLFDNKALIRLPSGLQVCIKWTTSSSVRTEARKISNNYGSISNSVAIILEYKISGVTPLDFEIAAC
ncbi:MAG: alginate lyase family protein [Caldilineaceae bacterium]